MSRTDALLRLVAQHADQLRQGFHNLVVNYYDALQWRRLEHDVADLLERRFDEVLDSRSQASSFAEFDEVLEQDVQNTLSRRDPSGSRAEKYRQAVDMVYENTAHWNSVLSDEEAAYWRHASLVWMALWHAAAAQTISPAELAEYLGLASPAPAIQAPQFTEPPAHAPAPAPEPMHAPAPEPVKVLSSSRFGLGERSVLDGTAGLQARLLHTSTFNTAITIGIAAAISTFIFGAVFSLGALTVAIPVVLLFGWVGAGTQMQAASERVARNMKLEYVEPENWLQQRMQEMSDAIGFSPAPRVGIFPSEDVNGFAVGSKDHNGAVIGVSQGAVDKLSSQQMDALLAHELGHIVTGDMARMMYAQCFQRSLAAWMLITPARALVRWAFSFLGEAMVLKLSRARELRADGFGAAVAGKASMIALLEVLEGTQPRAASATQVAPELFFRDVAQRYFRTHPTIRDRIQSVRSEERIRDLRGLTYSE
ncbi:hypothetical protein T281_06915 [Rhodomicrobium udaipurense JA643]|nr:hypothetical protein T281_06915 [Rhodomicrobium udaipurense JA643]